MHRDLLHSNTRRVIQHGVRNDLMGCGIVPHVHNAIDVKRNVFQRVQGFDSNINRFFGRSSGGDDGTLLFVRPHLFLGRVVQRQGTQCGQCLFPFFNVERGRRLQGFLGRRQSMRIVGGVWSNNVFRELDCWRCRGWNSILAHCSLAQLVFTTSLVSQEVRDGSRFGPQL